MRFEKRHADHESQRPRAGQAGRFRVQEEKVAKFVAVQGQPIVQGIRRAGRWLDGQQIGQNVLTMAMVGWIDTIDDKTGTVSGLDHAAAGEKRFQRWGRDGFFVARRKRIRNRRRRRFNMPRPFGDAQATEKRANLVVHLFDCTCAVDVRQEGMKPG